MVITKICKDLKSLADELVPTLDEFRKTSNYVPTFSDFNFPLNNLLDTRYINRSYGDIRLGEDAWIQAVRMGPLLFVRRDIRVDRFYEFWLGLADEPVEPSLAAIKAFLDETEGDGGEITPIPDALLEALDLSLARTSGPYSHFIPGGGVANSKTPLELHQALEVIHYAPKIIEHLHRVLEASVPTAENALSKLRRPENMHAPSKSALRSPERHQNPTSACCSTPYAPENDHEAPNVRNPRQPNDSLSHYGHRVRASLGR